MTPAPAQLPREDLVGQMCRAVENGRRLGYPTVELSLDDMSALLAEIEAGRTGAERVRIGDTDRLKVPKFTAGWAGIENAPDLDADALKAAKEAMVKASGLSPMWGENVAWAGARAAVTTYLAALRQAAQPSDGALVEVDCNCRQPGLGGDCDGSCYAQTGDVGRVLKRADAGADAWQFITSCGKPTNVVTLTEPGPEITANYRALYATTNPAREAVVKAAMAWDRGLSKVGMAQLDALVAACDALATLATTPAAPAQVGAQPAGRVEDAAMAWWKAGCCPGKEALALMDACRVNAIAPTAGAVDDGENGR